MFSSSSVACQLMNKKRSHVYVRYQQKTNVQQEVDDHLVGSGSASTSSGVLAKPSSVKVQCWWTMLGWLRSRQVDGAPALPASL